MQINKQTPSNQYSKRLHFLIFQKANLLYIFSFLIIMIWGIVFWGGYSDASIHGLLLIAIISVGLRVIKTEVSPLN